MSFKTVDIYLHQGDEAFAMPTAIEIFGFPISFYGICMVVAAVLALLIAVREAKKKGIDTEWILVAFQLVILFGVIGARVYYVVSKLPFYATHLSEIFDLRAGGLSFFGALLFSWVAVKLYCRKRKADFDHFADSLCISAAAAAIPVYVGQLFSLEPFGRYSTGALSVLVPASNLSGSTSTKAVEKLLSHSQQKNGVEYVSMQPVALYGLIFSVLTLVILLVMRRYIKQKGDVFTLYLLLNAVFSLVLEFLRAGDGTVTATGTITLNGLIAFVLLITVGVYSVTEQRTRKKRREKKAN